MAYLGRGLDKISNIEVLDNITFDGSSSYSITKGSVAFTPNSAQSCLISIDGVVQATNFTVSSSTIDFGVAIPSTSVCNFFLHYGTGVMTVPSDGSVTLDKLSATGTKNATTFLRGDNTFAVPIGMTLLSTTTLSGTSTSVSVTPTGYNELRIYVTGVNTGASNGYLLMGVNSDTTVTNYRNAWGGSVGYAYDDGFDNSLAGSLIYLFPGANDIKQGTTNNSAMITIGNPTSSFPKNIHCVSAFNNSSSSNSSEISSCNYVTSSAISSLQFKSDQSLTAGTVLIYGVK